MVKYWSNILGGAPGSTGKKMQTASAIRGAQQKNRRQYMENENQTSKTYGFSPTLRKIADSTWKMNTRPQKPIVFRLL